MALNCAQTLLAALAALRLKPALHSHIVDVPAVRSGLEVKKGEQHHPLR